MNTKVMTILLFVVLSGCVYDSAGRIHWAVPEPVSEALQTKPDCCVSLKDIRYEVTVPNSNKKQKIDDSLPAFSFESGKSYFLAYELPDTGPTVTITVESYFGRLVFHPAIMVLDERHQVLRTFNDDTFRYMPPTWTKPGRVEGTVRLTPATGPERYIIILTTDRLRKKVHTSSGGDVAHAYDYGPVGKLRIRFKSAG